MIEYYWCKRGNESEREKVFWTKIKIVRLDGQKDNIEENEGKRERQKVLTKNRKNKVTE